MTQTRYFLKKMASIRQKLLDQEDEGGEQVDDSCILKEIEELEQKALASGLKSMKKEDCTSSKTHLVMIVPPTPVTKKQTKPKKVEGHCIM